MADAPWPPQDGVGLLNLNGTLYMLGGWAPGTIPSPYTHSQVWKSSNGGVTWTRLADAPWEARHTAGWLVHDNKLWVIGGDMNSGHYQRDVWSSADGVTWVQATSNAVPLSDGRALHQVYSHAGKMWIVGGQTLDEFTPTDLSTKPGSSPYYDDVWSSTDGASWTLVSSGNSWAPRGLIMGSPVKDGYMWLVGGGSYNTEGMPRLFKSDVWRSADGVSWERVTADGGFAPRQYNSVTVLGDDLVMVAGYNGSNLADALISSDGISWAKVGTPPWQARHAASIVSHDGKVLMLGGPLNEAAVWALER